VCVSGFWFLPYDGVMCTSGSEGQVDLNQLPNHSILFAGSDDDGCVMQLLDQALSVGPDPSVLELKKCTGCK
jgi:hypothetical protein